MTWLAPLSTNVSLGAQRISVPGSHRYAINLPPNRSLQGGLRHEAQVFRGSGWRVGANSDCTARQTPTGETRVSPDPVTWAITAQAKRLSRNTFDMSLGGVDGRAAS
jgi:hypothetical protein